VSTPSDNAGYLHAVQALYLELRGGGLTLSPLDTDRIRAWRDAGVPLELALNGVRAAHKAWASGGSRMRPFALRGAERYVQELAAGYERRGGAMQAAAPAPRSPSRLETRREAGSPAARAAWEAVLAFLEGRASDPDALLAADEFQGIAYLRALPRREQRALAHAVFRHAGARGRVPRRGYRAMLRALLCEAAREHGGLVRPSDLT
jgi:hypothetical protein